MKQFLLVAILALGAIAPAHSEMTIQDYYDKCIAGEKIQAVQQACIAYAQGMFDGLAALQAMNKPVEVCIPTSSDAEKITGIDVYSVVNRHVEKIVRNPKFEAALKFWVAPLMVTAFETEWPCDK